MKKPKRKKVKAKVKALEASKPAIRFETVLLGDRAGDAGIMPRQSVQQSKPLLLKWPRSHTGGAFKIDGSDIVIFAKGRPDIRLSNAF
jgi:hypothetical protein